MKRWLTRILIFFSALSLGLAATWLVLTRGGGVAEVGSDPDLNAPITSPSDTEFSRRPSGPESVPHEPEFVNVRIPEEFENGDFRSLVPIFEDGDGGSLGKCEVTEETKRPWLGLFRRGEEYSLENVAVKFGRPRKDDFGVFIPLRFSDSSMALFLIGNDNRIKPGPVRTLYEMPYGGDKDSLIGEGFRKEFEIGGRKYTLRSASGTSESNSPVFVVVLEGEDKFDLLFYRDDSGGNIGKFEWVGDLDNDQRLDLLFSFFAVNGGGKNYILFLSSVAGRENLVQPYAFFRTQFRGC